MTPTILFDLAIIISNIEQNIEKASNLYNAWMIQGDPFDEPSWSIEGCFLQLMMAAEALNLSELRRMIEVEYLQTKQLENGFTQSADGPDGEFYSPVLSRIRLFLRTLKVLLPSDEHKTVQKDVDQIIRNLIYVITDTTLFSDVPRNERDVHLRIEAVLKCVFPDLKTKPTLTKQIKNFEPDTGIASIETLIEYKFLSRKEDAPIIADQLLADTRGYASRDWSSFLYVIYETRRFRTEHDWNQLMRQSGLAANTRVVVLSGEPEPDPTGSSKLPRTSKALPKKTRSSPSKGSS